MKVQKIQLKEGLHGNDAGIYYQIDSGEVYRVVWYGSYPIELRPGESWRDFSFSSEQAHKVLKEAEEKVKEAREKGDFIDLGEGDRMLCASIRESVLFHLSGSGFGKDFCLVAAEEHQTELKLICFANKLEEYRKKITSLAEALTLEDVKLLVEKKEKDPKMNLDWVTPKPWEMRKEDGFLASPRCSRVSFARFKELAEEILRA